MLYTFIFISDIHRSHEGKCFYLYQKCWANTWVTKFGDRQGDPFYTGQLALRIPEALVESMNTKMTFCTNLSRSTVLAVLRTAAARKDPFVWHYWQSGHVLFGVTGCDFGLNRHKRKYQAFTILRHNNLNWSLPDYSFFLALNAGFCILFCEK